MDYLTWSVALILLGLALLAADLFLPSGGILSVLAITALIVGIVFSFNVSGTVGLSMTLAVALFVPGMLFLWTHYFPKTFVGRQMFLQAPTDDEFVTNNPVTAELEQLRGRFGKTISALRPSGTTEFDGRRVDAMSEGNLIEPGNWVQCVDVKPGRVIVRKVDAPPDLDDMELDLS